MDNKDIIKRKNDLFRSIMANPKLSKTFSEAMAAPVGSTKRKQAKSVLSIMKKVGGRQDGRGGLMDSFGSFGSFNSNPFGSTAQSTTSSSITPTSTNNLVILPAAPAPKVQMTPMPAVSTPTKINMSSTVTAPNYFSSPSSTTVPKTVAPISTSAPSSTSWPSLSSSFAAPTTSPVIATSTTTPTATTTRARAPVGTEPEITRVPGKLLPAASTAFKTLGGLSAGLFGGAQYALQNSLAYLSDAGQAIRRTVAGEYRNKYGDLVDKDGKLIPKIEHIKFADTYGGRAAGDILANAYPSLGSAVVSATSGTKAPATTATTTPVTTGSTTATQGQTNFSSLFGGGATSTPAVSTVTATTPGTYGNVSSTVKTGVAPAVITSGYDGSIAPTLRNKKISELTDEEKVQLYQAQRTREGSTLKNNPFGIKQGPATEHWIAEGKAKPGVEATDGGRFLEFNDENTALQAYGELLYGPTYSNLTVDDAMKKWSGAVTGSQQESTDTKPFVALSADQYQKLSPAERSTYDSAAAQDAIKRGIGKEAFALEQTPLQFGGNLNELVAKQKQELRTEHGLDQMEQELSELKSKKENFIPTLSKYITGRDEYLTKIDKSIEEWEKTRKTLDMGDPTVNASYRKHLAYLYTLRGRQAERYGNFLKSAVADYEADVADLQSRYDNEYARFTDEVSSGAAITQETYNTRLQSMASLYQELDGLEAKRLNMKLLQDQSDNNDILKLDNLTKASGASDPDYMKDYDATLKKIADNDGNLEIESVGVSGLYGLYATAFQAGQNTNAVTDAVNKAISMTLRSQNTTDPTKTAPGSIEKVKEIKTMIDDFVTRMSDSNDPAGKAAAQAIRDNFVLKSSQPILKGYVIDNLEAIKEAIKELTNKKGVPTQQEWLNDHSDLDYDLMMSLYTYLVAAMKQAIAAKPELTPAEFLAPALNGSDDQIAQTVAGAMTAGW